MKSEQAKAYFHGTEGFNCAQAVFKTFQNEFGVTDAHITANKKNGGGRVQNNICGALFAAKELLPNQADKITELFNERAQFPTCREIKKLSQYPCRECVGLAAEIVERLT